MPSPFPSAVPSPFPSAVPSPFPTPVGQRLVLSCPPYSLSNTATALQSFVKCGMSLTVGIMYTISTCVEFGGSSSGSPRLLLFDVANEMIDNNNTVTCADGMGTQLSYTPSTSGLYSLHQGCEVADACSASVQGIVDLFSIKLITNLTHELY